MLPSPRWRKLKVQQALRKWTHKGLRCEVWPGGFGLGYCGYVEIPQDHQLLRTMREDGHFDDDYFHVHGGVSCAQYHEIDKVFWVGWDTGHGYTPPSLQNLEFMVEETNRLAAQVLKYPD
jgi:hypothetical protein